MQRIPTFSLLLSLLFSLAMFADEEQDESLREKQRQARELAQEVLTGRQVRVRVYNDWKKDPRVLDNDKLLQVICWELQGIKIPEDLRVRLLDPRLFSNESLTRMKRDLVKRGIIFKHSQSEWFCT